jgi:hypothetical protein
VGVKCPLFLLSKYLLLNKYKIKKYTYIMKKQMIRLTESELHQIIEESVKNIIKENMEQEGWLDTAKSFAGQYRKRGQEVVDNVISDIKKTAKNARRDSSMKDMSRAFEAFKAAVQKYIENGGEIKSQLKGKITSIDNMINGYQRSY